VFFNESCSILCLSSKQREVLRLLDLLVSVSQSRKDHKYKTTVRLWRKSHTLPQHHHPAVMPAMVKLQESKCRREACSLGEHVKNLCNRGKVEWGLLHMSLASPSLQRHWVKAECDFYTVYWTCLFELLVVWQRRLVQCHSYNPPRQSHPNYLWTTHAHKTQMSISEPHHLPPLVLVEDHDVASSSQCVKLPARPLRTLCKRYHAFEKDMTFEAS